MLNEILDGLLQKRPSKKPLPSSFKSGAPVQKCLSSAHYVAKPYVKPSLYNEYNKDQLQFSHMTRPERFPAIMDSAKKLRPDAKRILSFGCSTGEECFSLAKRFTNADEIIGVDIDHCSIQSARKSNKMPNIFFHDELNGLGQFDLITCLMVLFVLEQPLPKERWRATIEKLDKHLKPGGVIMIYTSDYDPIEVLGTKYENLNVWTREHNKKPGSNYFNGYYLKKDI